MRKFSHREALEIALNIIYVALFFALVAYGSSNADSSFDGETGATEYYDCMNCDEID